MDFGLGLTGTRSQATTKAVGLGIVDLNARSGRSGTLRATAARLDAALRQRAGRSGHLSSRGLGTVAVAGTAET